PSVQALSRPWLNKTLGNCLDIKNALTERSGRFFVRGHPSPHERERERGGGEGTFAQ
ncbi:MAG: hypothetical protein RL230_2964, partial [Pseudomonadota bacterium]